VNAREIGVEVEHSVAHAANASGAIE